MKAKPTDRSLCWLLTALTAILLGCGDDASGPTETDDDAPPIKIGLLTTLSGALSRIGPAHRAAVNMAAEEINDGGGVLGRTIEIVVADTGTDPEKATAGARELIAQDVAAIVGPNISSSVIEVATKVTVPEGMLLISPSATAGEITALEDDGLIWRTAASDAFKGKIAAHYAFESGSRTAGLLLIDNSFGRGLAAEFAAEFTRLGGRVVNTIDYPELRIEEIEGYDYRPHLVEVMEEEPDLIYLISLVEDGIKIVISANDLLSSTYHPRFLSEIPPTEQLLGEVGTYEGLIVISQESSTDQNHVVFLEKYQDRYQSAPELFTESAYDALYLLALAMGQAGSTAPADIAAQLQSVSSGGTKIGVGEFTHAAELIAQVQDIDYDGASGAIDYDANGDVTSGTFQVWKIEDGRFADAGLLTFP